MTADRIDRAMEEEGMVRVIEKMDERASASRAFWSSTSATALSGKCGQNRHVQGGYPAMIPAPIDLDALKANIAANPVGNMVAMKRETALALIHRCETAEAAYAVEAQRSRGEPDWKERYGAEHEIVSRIWRQLGVTGYTGKSIYEHIDDLKQQAAGKGKADAA